MEAERDRLLQLIQAICDSGRVAPINVWISPAPKGEHIYYKLSSKNPDIKNLHLSKAGSEKYRDWRARIQRREAIAIGLEQQMEEQLRQFESQVYGQLEKNIAQAGEQTVSAMAASHSKLGQLATIRKG